jgi:hypothetical protein
MSIKVHIADPGSGKVMHGEEFQALRTMPINLPPLGIGRGTTRIFRAFFTNAAGSSDMLVDGGTTPVEFTIKANQDNERDIYISTVSFVIEDGSAVLNKFGGVTALTNGVRFHYFDTDVGEIDIHDAMKTNFDFVRLGLGNPAFAGSATTTFLADKTSAGNTTSYIPVVDFRYVFGLPYGIELKAGSRAKLVLTIRDDLTAGTPPETFDCIAYGFEVNRERTKLPEERLAPVI